MTADALAAAKRHLESADLTAEEVGELAAWLFLRTVGSALMGATSDDEAVES